MTALLAGLFVVLGIWGFIELADEVMEGETQGFDQWVVSILRSPENQAIPRGPRWLLETARDVTGLGSHAVLALVTLAATGLLLALGKHDSMWLILIATSGGALLSFFLKILFARERPDIPHGIHITSWAFPSGHALVSAIVYLSLGALLARIVPGRVSKLYVLLFAIFLTFLIGTTRIYLGVHYPTDVLAGWSVGFSWALFCWLVAQHLQKRGRMERIESNGPQNAKEQCKLGDSDYTHRLMLTKTHQTGYTSNAGDAPKESSR